MPQELMNEFSLSWLAVLMVCAKVCKQQEVYWLGLKVLLKANTTALSIYKLRCSIKKIAHCERCNYQVLDIAKKLVSNNFISPLERTRKNLASIVLQGKVFGPNVGVTIHDVVKQTQWSI